MEIGYFLEQLDSAFYTGVPDSKLKALCDYLTVEVGVGVDHIIAANEGNCAALAAGYHLATGKVPVVYLQNSGIGNIMNPVASLLHEKVYGIPCLFIVGWRGEPGEHDEPQHVFQGEISETVLRELGLYVVVLSEADEEAFLRQEVETVKNRLGRGQSVAFLIKKGVLSYDRKVSYQNSFAMKREEVLSRIIAAVGEGVLVSTTGKTSRELFELREKNGQGHDHDFLTVGSMGHSSSIALGIALQKPGTKVWCIDGDGAVLMHMGAMAVIGSQSPGNLVHIVINNEAHESVGGMPTVAGKLRLDKIAEGCGYAETMCVADFAALETALEKAKNSSCLSFIEIKCSIGSRKDLGRPTTTPGDNKEAFMAFLRACQ